MTETPTFPAEDGDELVLDPAAEDRLLRDTPWTRFAGLGDSLVAGAGDHSPGYRPAYWVDRIADALRRTRPRLEHLNVAERDRRIDHVVDVQLPEVVDFAPDLVVVNGGGNDMFAEGFDLDRTTARFDELVGALTATGADVVTFTMFGMRDDLSLPEPAGSRLNARMDAWQQAVVDVSRRHATRLIDFSRHPAAGSPGIYSDDLVHLNTRGHAMAASWAIESLAGVRAVDA